MILDSFYICWMSCIASAGTLWAFRVPSVQCLWRRNKLHKQGKWNKMLSLEYITHKVILNKNTNEKLRAVQQTQARQSLALNKTSCIAETHSSSEICLAFTEAILFYIVFSITDPWVFDQETVLPHGTACHRSACLRPGSWAVLVEQLAFSKEHPSQTHQRQNSEVWTCILFFSIFWESYTRVQVAVYEFICRCTPHTPTHTSRKTFL